jgi:hypothetical protein
MATPARVGIGSSAPHPEAAKADIARLAELRDKLRDANGPSFSRNGFAQPAGTQKRPKSLAIARMPDQRGCNGKPLCQPSQPPHEYGPGIRPKDAKDEEARTPRSRGRFVVVLYHEVRTHLSLNKDAPAPRPVQRAGYILCRPILGGLHH